MTRFQATAAEQPGADHRRRSCGATVTIPPIASATAAPTSSGPSRLNTRGEQHRLERTRRARGDERGDRVGRVVQAVRDRERERQRYGEPKAGTHAEIYSPTGAVELDMSFNACGWACSLRRLRAASASSCRQSRAQYIGGGPQ